MHFEFLEKTRKTILDIVKIDSDPPYYEGDTLNNMIEQIIGMRFHFGSVKVESSTKDLLRLGENISFVDYADQFKAAWESRDGVISAKTTVIEISQARGLRDNPEWRQLKAALEPLRVKGVQDGEEYELDGKTYKLYVFYPEFPPFYVYNHRQQRISDDLRSATFSHIEDLLKADPELLEYRYPKERVDDYYRAFVQSFIFPMVEESRSNPSVKKMFSTVVGFYEFCGLDMSSEIMLLPDVYMNLLINIMDQKFDADLIELIESNLEDD